MLVAGRAFFVGPGCFVCPWAAARPRAVRAASLRLGASSRSPPWPCRRPPAPQPGPSRPSGALHTGGACGAVQAPQATWCPPIGRGVCVLPGQAYPLLTGIAAWPSGPCGAARLLMSGWACSGRRLGRLSWSGPERDIAPADRSSAWHESAVKEISPQRIALVPGMHLR